MSTTGYTLLKPVQNSPQPSTLRSSRTRIFFIALASSVLIIIGILHRFRPNSQPDTSLRPDVKGPGSVTMNGNIPRPNGKVNVGHFTNWGFANLKEETGEVHLTDSWADQEIHYDDNDSWNDENASSNLYGNLKQLYLHKKRNRHLKVLLSIAGWTYSENGRFGRGVRDDTKRAKFVESAVKFGRGFRTRRTRYR
ncbi:hypothetical protein JCM16303_000488 [Sporobolomyces ruberrimus]